MKYRRLDPNGDYALGLGNSAFAKDIDAVSQAIITRLKWLWNEWWERQNDGFPLFEKVLTYGSSQQEVDVLFSDWINGTVGVIGVKDLVSKLENRQYSMSCVVETIYGTTSFTYPLEV